MCGAFSARKFYKREPAREVIKRPDSEDEEEKEEVEKREREVMAMEEEKSLPGERKSLQEQRLLPPRRTS